MPKYAGPLLTRALAEALVAARDAGAATWSGSLDLGRSTGEARLDADGWTWRDVRYPWPGKLKDRTLYHWDGDDFAAVSRFSGGLIKLVPTDWGAPTFEIDGIKMLPTAKTSPTDDARRKVALVRPQGRAVLDTCGGLGYFAACALEAGAARTVTASSTRDPGSAVAVWSPCAPSLARLSCTVCVPGSTRSSHTPCALGASPMAPFNSAWAKHFALTLTQPWATNNA